MLDIVNNKWEFPVEIQPVFDQMGNQIIGSQCVVRTDTNAVLGVHGSKYKLVSNDLIIDHTIEAVKAANISRDYTVKIKTADNGAKMRGEINFPDITIQPRVGDITNFRISFTNSYDASWSFSLISAALRLICLNGMVRPDATASSRFKHTANINVEGAAAKVRHGVDGFFEENVRWKHWMGINVSDEMAELFFKHTLSKAPSLQQLKFKTNEKQLENLLGIWRNEKAALGPNKWALYNAMTYWSTHTSELRNPLVASMNREAQVVSAMNSKHFTQLEGAY